MARVVGPIGLAGALVMLLAPATACNDPQSPKLAAGLLPPTNAIVVTVVSSGSDIPNGYTVWVDDSQSQSVGANGVVSFVVGAGLHTVLLDAVPSNCTVSGDNPRHVFLPVDGYTGATTFTVSCVSKGGLFISTNTTGVDLPANGYTVTVDGASQPIATNGTVTITDLASGTHSVTLSGVAANCAVSGSNPQTVTVRSGATVPAPFSVSCAQTGSGSGSLTVTTTTTGSNAPSTGYTVTVDGTSSQPIATNGSVTFTVPAGANPVALSGVPSNCAVSGANPTTVTVPAGGAVTTTFSVTCGVPVARALGNGQIGMGPAALHANVQTFDFDVRADLTGRFHIIAWDDVQPDGQAGALTTDPVADPTTYFTAYRSSSNACSDPSRGVEFDAVGRERTGAVVSYTVSVCDNGPAGSGKDFFSFFIPVEDFGRSGVVTSGDVVKQ